MITEVLVERVRQRLISHGDADAATPALVTRALRDEGVVLGDSGVLELVSTLRDELIGLGPLRGLLDDPAVTDILVNPPGEVWIDRGHGMERGAVRMGSESAVRRLAQRLASAAGRRLDDASPYVDARLPDGIRLHAAIPPIAPEGTLLSLRIPRRRAFDLSELVAAGTVGPSGAQWLAEVMRQRLSFLVTGGTGSGKTTILSTLLGLAAPTERLLLVEDSAELRPDHPHVVRLEARPPNLEGAGAVTLRDLVRQALRMRPDRVVVGEVRGAEVVDLLSALNTGHEGGCGTVHANSAADVPARLEALGLAAGIPRPAVHALVAAGLDAVVHVERSPVDGSGRGSTRRVQGVFVIRRDPSGQVVSVPALVRRGSDLVPGEAAGDLQRLLARDDRAGRVAEGAVAEGGVAC